MTKQHDRKKGIFNYGLLPVLLWICMVTMVNANVSKSERNGILRTFQNLAIQDSQSAVNVWATPGVSKSWREMTQGALEHPRLSAALLAPAIVLAAPDGSKDSVGGYFNPWINAALVLKIDKTKKGPRITDLSLKLFSDNASFRNMSPEECRELLLNRYTKVNNLLNDAGESWHTFKADNDKSGEWAELKNRLDLEISTARGALARDGNPEMAPLRMAFGTIMMDLRQGGTTTGLSFTGKEPREWKQTLAPVHVSEFETYPVVFLASRGYPLSFLWLEIDADSYKPVKKSKVIHIPALK